MDHLCNSLLWLIMNNLPFDDLKALGCSNQVMLEAFETNPVWINLKDKYNLQFHSCLISDHFCQTCRELITGDKCVNCTLFNSITFSKEQICQELDIEIESLHKILNQLSVDFDDFDDFNNQRMYSLEQFLTIYKIFSVSKAKLFETDRVLQILFTKQSMIERFNNMKIPEPELKIIIPFSEQPSHVQERWYNLWCGYVTEWLANQSYKTGNLLSQIEIPEQWKTSMNSSLYQKAYNILCEKYMAQLDPACNIVTYSNSMFDKELQIKSFYKVKRPDHVAHLKKILPMLFKKYVNDENIVQYILDVYPRMSPQFISGQITACKKQIINALSEQILNDNCFSVNYKNRNLLDNIKKIVFAQDRERQQFYFRTLAVKHFPFMSKDQLCKKFGFYITKHISRLEFNLLRKVHELPPNLYRREVIAQLGLEQACEEYKVQFSKAYGKLYNSEHLCEECYVNNRKKMSCLCGPCQTYIQKQRIIKRL